MCFRAPLFESDIPTVPLGFRYKHHSENRSQKKTERQRAQSTCSSSSCRVEPRLEQVKCLSLRSREEDDFGENPFLVGGYFMVRKRMFMGLLYNVNKFNYWSKMLKCLLICLIMCFHIGLLQTCLICVMISQKKTAKHSTCSSSSCHIACCICV